jgi:methylenetetrahydrofolate dehydrogenase (NADP+)/methenyltetrahydrofolate cyclohydrolase
VILDGKLVRDKILEGIKLEIDNEKLDLTLAILLIGDFPQSEIYVRNKIKACEKVGIKTKLVRLEKASEEQVIDIIQELNNDSSITGIILQSPVPENINMDNCIKYISPKKDVDGFTKDSFYSLGHNLAGLHPCTAKGIIRLLKYYNIPLEGKKVCLIGRGNLVGKPLIFEMLKENATVTVCHTKTKNLKEITLNSDVIVCGCGKAKMLTADMVSPGSIVVDAGISVIDGKIIGDADFDNLKDKCAYITPNPGGVGPMTIAMIIENILEAYKGGSVNG